ncbi:GDSL-type esterase/lipase family protein [Danxiaibacter flavus]|uniref:GDSL-type esterase/lipase family protein n=1 Tax=Danxiaibacter flavus TaxID=3049108 RepID=A0ABV3Z9G1_9BACT|nr:GDSL-type esterase/lipase family protein [Chitinophagaceae bacterium DXS]
MKQLNWLTIAMLTLCIKSNAQDPASPDTSYANGYYMARVHFFEKLHPAPKPIVFLGNSITEAGAWSEVLPGRNVVNRGISGDNSYGVLARLDQVLAAHPSKIFLLIGINDLKRGTSPVFIAGNYVKIVEKIKKTSPKTKLFLQSVLPVNEGMLPSIYSKINNEIVRNLNDSLSAIANRYKVPFIDLHEIFEDDNHQLKKEFSTDGLHLKPDAYILWAEYLTRKKYL